MSEFFVLLPLDADVASWLEECGLHATEATQPSRPPTPAEILRAAHEAGWRTEVTGPTPLGHWHVLLDHESDHDRGPWAFITVHPYQGPDTPSSTVFERGWAEVIVSIPVRLAPHIGPFVIQPSSGASPILVEATTTEAEALSRWSPDSEETENGDTGAA